MKKAAFILIVASLLAAEVFAKDSVIVDSRDNQSYPVVTIDGKRWMGKNLNYAGGNGELGSKAAGCDTCGRVYNWAETRLMAACTRMFCLDGTNNCNTCVGGFCPRGWRVPEKAELEKFIAVTGGGKASPVSGGNSGKTVRWWSSTEVDADNAVGSWGDANNVSIKNYGKTQKMFMRCVEE